MGHFSEKWPTKFSAPLFRKVVFEKVLFGKVLMKYRDLKVLFRRLLFGKVAQDAALHLASIHYRMEDFNDVVEEEERMVQEERDGYAEAVRLTLSEEDHTKSTYDRIKRCTTAEELMSLVGELPQTRYASGKSLTFNRILKAVDAGGGAFGALKEKTLQAIHLDPNDKIPSMKELEKHSHVECVLKALGETTDNEAMFKMREAALEGFKTVRALFFLRSTLYITHSTL